ncbi:MAG: CRISPR-associated endonuclease Cas2, partial [Culicoidibacterales bacterium]
MYVIVAYDFNEKRVAKALKISRKYLTPVQNSIFEGDLTMGQLNSLKAELEKIMD